MGYRIFVVNPGSTSTKVALFEDKELLVFDKVFHDSSVLRRFPTINDQLDYRMAATRELLREKNIDLNGIDAIVGRGGASYSVASGVYEVSDLLIQHTREARGGLRHVSSLGIQIGRELQKEYGGRLFMVDPTVVDEYQDLARITGLKGIYRRSIGHFLNQKATARQHAAALGRFYEDCRFIVCHIDGGVSVTAHEYGRMIDGNDAGGGQGPFTPTRMGSLAITDVAAYLSDKTADELYSLCMESGGFSSHFGTSDSDIIHARVDSGDKEAARIWQAFIYQIAKSIGAMSVVLKGDVDSIILTGGLMRFKDIEEGIRDYCGHIAPIAVYPNEIEFEAMAYGALSVLRGETEPLTYSGRPVWDGFHD